MTPPSNGVTPEAVDWLITGATVFTLNQRREIILDGAVAIKADRIVAVGKSNDLKAAYRAARQVDGRGKLLLPGFVDGHVHMTGDPLTGGMPRPVSPDGHADTLMRYVIPLYRNHTPEDEHFSVRFNALRMLKNGTTCFMEAGTVSHLDACVDGLRQVGIRGRVSEWIEGRVFDPDGDQAAESAKEIGRLEAQIAKYPADDDTLIAATPVLVGHVTNSDEVWQAAKAMADQHGLAVSAHMSPLIDDSEWYVANLGRRPIEHLAHIGALGPTTCLTHVAHIDENEMALIVSSGTNVIHCPHNATHGAFGVTQVGLFPEMLDAGVNIMLGSDGEVCDLIQAAKLASGIFRDARRDKSLMPAHRMLEMATVNGAQGIGVADLVGSIEVGKKADIVLHDTQNLLMRPLLDPVDQFITNSDGRHVDSVWVDGERLIENGRSTQMDEEAMLVEAQQRGEEIIARCGLDDHKLAWPVV